MKQSTGRRICILFLLAFFGSGMVSAQKIEIRSDTVFVNSKKLTNRMKAADIQEILGKANRISKLESTILTYDDLGLKIYLDRATQIVGSIELDLVKENYDFSPKTIFHGTFSINGKTIDRSTSISALTQIKEIGFHHSVLDLYTGTIPGMILTFTISEDKHQLEGIAVSYGSDQ